MPTVRDSTASVTQLHPEHLLDKWGEGGLTPMEQRQLHSHAAACEACRFELLVRGDLALECSNFARARAGRSVLGFGTGG
jgi:hypothetical protein